MNSPLAKAAARGTLFTMLAQLTRILLQLLSVVVLARLLSPHDYGLLAIVLVVVGLGELLRDFGLTSATVQAPEFSIAQRDNLFWINTLIGVILATLMFASSWALGAITGQPELTGMAQWLSLLFVMNGLATQYRASLMRSVRLKALAIVDVTASAFALAIAVAVAFYGGGFWALVVQQLANGGIALVGAVIAGHWIPKWYDRKAPIRGFVTFGWNLVAANLVQYASRQVDTIVIATRLGPGPLGLYDRAHQLVMTPLGQVRAPLQSVALPVLSRIQTDQPRFNTYVAAAQLALGYTLGIPLAIVAGLAVPVVDIMLGERWAETVPLLRSFAIAGIMTTLAYVGYWVYVSRGLGAQLLRYTMVSSAIKVVCVLVGSMFGLVGIAVGYMVHPAIAWPISLFWLSRVTPIPVGKLYGGAGRVLALAAVAGLGAWGVSLVASGAGSIACVLLGVVAGLALPSLAMVLPVFRRDFRSLATFARLMLSKRSRA